MFRPTTGIALLGLIVVGIIIADIWSNPAGTKAAGNAFVAIVTPTEQALAGQRIG